MPRNPINSRRSRTSCSIIALATVMAVGATPAAAQSLLGTGTYATNPNATGIVAPLGGTTTTINLNGGQTVIDWTPTDNATNPGAPIVFQNNGTTATFTSGSDFAVLNRIEPTDMSRAIHMNGTVNARVGNAQRGSVYFYSPNGFVFGGTSVFSVGSLVVTTSPITMTGDDFINGTTVEFGQTLNPNAAISSNGAINANYQPLGFPGPADSSYVAMVAPHVTHSGSITVNGSAALVAAEAATINFSPDGLFDIQVTAGTTHANGIAVHGDIGGPTPLVAADKQSVFLVAVPKNQLLTMVIGQGSDLGFTLASDATVDDSGAVILSAGHDIENGAIGDKSAGHGSGTGSFWFTGAHATSNLVGEATGTADLYSTDAQASQKITVFDSDVTVHASQSVRMGAAGVGSSLSVGGDVSLSADKSGAEGQSVTAGLAELYAFSGGTVTVSGDATVTADGFGGNSGETIAAGAGTGGTALLNASSGSSIAVGNTDFGGNVHLSASGNGGTGFEGGSGNGTGGTVSIQASADGDISIFGDTDAFAEGRGGTNWDSSANGGVGQGGDIFVGASGTGSTLSLTGALMSANGIGGGAGEGTCCAAIGGAGIGGLVSVTGSDGALIESNGTLEFSAAGEGGYASGIGGGGTGGQNGDGVFVDVLGGIFDVTGSLWLDATGTGGDGEAGGGNGTGGEARVNVSGGSLDVSDQINVDADGFGGDSEQGGNGGTGTGGLAVVATNGGMAQLNALNVLIEADGTGGDSFNFSEGPLGDGGDGFGGRTRIAANDGSIHITGNLDMDATSTGGSGANGGDATGVVTPSTDEGLPPAAFLWAGAATAELRVDGLTDIDVSATGGAGFDGNGGNASGGEVDIASRHGDVRLLGNVTGNADALGGAGGFGGGSGGNAFGGVIDVSWSIDQTTGLSGSIAMATPDPEQPEAPLETVMLSANGTGGDGGEGLFTQEGPGGTGGAGGNGTGGGISYNGSAGGGTLDVGSTTIQANGAGGDGGNGGSGETGGNGGAGGIGNGGFIQTGTISNSGSTTSGGTATFTVLSASANASGGTGGDGGEGVGGLGLGGNGGNAIGGQTSFLVRGVVVTADSVNLFANATGGDAGSGSIAGDGGDAFTGFVSVESKDRFGHPTQRGSLTANTINGTAIAQGGNGATNGTSTVRGGSFFRVLNGDANIGSTSFTFAGDLYDGTTVYEGTTGPNYIQAQGGTGTITGSFTYNTTGQLAIYTTNTGTLDVGALSLSAGNYIDHPTLVGPAIPGTIFADTATITTGLDFFADAHFDIAGNLVINAPGRIAANDFTIGGNLDLSANGGGLTAGDLDVSGDINLDATGAIDVGTVLAGFFRGDSGGTFDADDITSDADIRIGAGDDVTLGNLIAGVPAGESSKAVRIDTDGSVLVGNITAAGGIDVTAAGTVTGENVTTGDVLITEADGAIVYKNISAGLVNPQPPSEPFAVALDSATSIKVDNVVATRGIAFITPGTLTTLDLTTDTDVLGLVHGAIDTGDISADGRVLLADSSMFTNAGGTFGDAGDDNIDPETIFAATPIATGSSISVLDVAAGEFSASAGSSLTTGAIDSDAEIGLDANGAISTGNLIAGDFVLANGGSITTGSIDADSVDMASTGGNITVNGDINAFGSVELDAFGDILAQDIIAGSIDLFAGDDITTQALTTEQLVLVELDEGFGTLLFPGASITLESGGDIVTGAIDSIDGVYANAGGSLTTGTIDAVDFVELLAVNDIETQDIAAGDDIFITSSSGGIDTGDLAGFGIELDAAGAILFDDVDGYDFDFSAGGLVDGGNIVVAHRALGEAAGSVTLGNITAGPIVPFDDFSVGIAAIGNVTVENVTGAGNVGFVSQGNLQTGNLASGDLVMTLAGGNITTGSITTDGEGGGQVYMADDSMFFTGGGTIDGQGDFNPGIVLGLDPVATGGSIAINGAVDTSLFRAAAGTSLATQGIIADEIEASAGGTATLNGVWDFTDFVTLESNDINITGTGGIDGGTTGDILLISTNPTQMLIGDGLSGTGYALSNAEFGRLSGTDVGIVGRGDASAAQDMLIGDLTVTGPSAGSTIESSEGILVFAVGDSDSESASGVIRVLGDINATGFGSGNAIEFYADRFELDAATGSISILSSGSTLGGELGLYADRIHVAAGSILNQLASNPTYTNYQQDLNKAATVQRPEGVLRADTLWIESDNLQDILIQNTGTAAAPAGFLVRQAFVNEDFEVAGPSGSINMVVNGQVVTEGGTLTGIAARDELITEETDTAPFTANSTINGCPLTGPCIIAPPPPPPTANVVDNQIDLLGDDPLGDSEFGNEDSIDDGEEGDEGAQNPISPPQPLFDTRPLIPSSDVNDPVSGTGNPALLGGVEDCVDDENNQCGTKKEDGQ